MTNFTFTCELPCNSSVLVNVWEKTITLHAFQNLQLKKSTNIQNTTSTKPTYLHKYEEVYNSVYKTTGEDPVEILYQ